MTTSVWYSAPNIRAYCAAAPLAAASGEEGTGYGLSGSSREPARTNLPARFSAVPQEEIERGKEVVL